MTSESDAANSSRRVAAVVLNGKAGALVDTDGGTAELEALFRNAGLEPTFVAADGGTLPQRIERALATNPDLLVVGGGDGTVACAAQAMSGRDIPLGILPFGTMNLLAHDLGIPIGDVAAAVALLADGTSRDIDVGDVNGHRFLCASMLGLPSRMARYREMGRGRGLPGRLWVIGRAAWRTVMRAHRARFGIAADGAAAAAVRAYALTIAVNGFDSESGRLFGRSCLDGGSLTLYLLSHLSWREAARLSTRVAFNAWHTDRAIEQSRAAEFDVTARRKAMRVMNDGEVVLLAPPLCYRLHRRALRVIGQAPA